MTAVEPVYFKAGAFPFVTRQELAAGIKKQARDPASAKRWLQLAKSCKTPQTYPCSVGVGNVTLRVYDDKGSDSGKAMPRIIKEWTLVLPQGC